MKLVLLGAPGSGKGSFSEYIKQQFNIPHISTGEIFREAMQAKTTLGILAKSFIDKGNLVPDDVTIALVSERLNKPDCVNGFLLDGFPRTLEQGKALTKITNLDSVIYLDVDYDLTKQRLINRRTCKSCGAIYSMLRYDKTTCERCGGELMKRDDDVEEVIDKRFAVYKTQTYPLVQYYKKLNLLRTVNGDGSIEKVLGDIFIILGGINAQTKN